MSEEENIKEEDTQEEDAQQEKYEEKMDKTLASCSHKNERSSHHNRFISLIVFK